MSHNIVLEPRAQDGEVQTYWNSDINELSCRITNLLVLRQDFLLY